MNHAYRACAPRMVIRAGQSLRLRAADAADSLRRGRDPLTPPRRLTGYVGDSDFRATGEEFLVHFRELADLQPSDRVLDVGCGIGRMARVLAEVLQTPGSYDGFDIVPEGISWCQAHYRGQAVPFRFQVADLHNATYNPGGSQAAADYRFPYEAAAFDLVLATSVFTHLLPDAADRYLEESARVLAPGGRLFATWYLLVGDRAVPAPPPVGWHQGPHPAAIADVNQPEAAVAFPEDWLRERLDAHGFQLRGLHPGSWRGQPGRSHQDIVVATRG